jgi:hypothetical protein
MRGSSCITCGHHPRPPSRRLIRNGGLYQKQSKHRHINRVEVGVGDGVVVGEVDGERRLKKTFISSSYRDPLLVLHLFIGGIGRMDSTI